MAELVWKHKHLPTIPSHPQRLITNACYPATCPPPQDIGWQNRLIYGEREGVLTALLPELQEAVDLIYIDPPFMTGRTFNKGSQLAYRDTWKNDLDSYLQWLYETLSYLHLLLSRRGSMYIHLDWRAAHYAKIMLDEIFGGAGFKNEIIWHYRSGGHTKRYFARKHDTLLLYTKSSNYCFHGERIGDLRGPEKRNHMRKVIESDGRVTWTIRSSGKIYTYSEDQRMPLTDVWSDISHLHQKDPERSGYATQKPLALIERLILASSEEGDLVLDCFCGSGVTPAAAERNKRRWIASDKGELAILTTQERLLAYQERTAFVIQHLAEKG